MKEYRIMILLVSTLFIIAMSCSSQLDNEDFSDMIGKGQNYTPPPVPVEEPTLKDKEGWKIDSIDGKSFIWYSYNKSAFNARQQSFRHLSSGASRSGLSSTTTTSTTRTRAFPWEDITV